MPDGINLRLSGNWTVAAGAPRTHDLLQALQQAPAHSRIMFDTDPMQQWDSGLLPSLSAVIDYGRQQGVDVDRAGLPAGVNRLLDLAYAVSERKGARRQTRKKSFLYDVGTDMIDGIRATGEFIAFFGDCIIALGSWIKGRAVYRRSDLWRIIQETGAQALPIVSLVSFLVGLILAFVGAVQLQQFGAGIYVADLVGIAITREMGAIMTGIIMAGRTGAAFAAELGSMTVNEEIDAMETSGFSPMQFLVLPRMLALMLMMPLLAVYADLMGILGGAAVAVPILGLTAGEYFREVYRAVSINDFLAGIFMAMVFGVIVSVVGCLNGIKCGRSAQAVGTATTSAVVSTIVLIVVACATLTVIFNAIGI